MSPNTSPGSVRAGGVVALAESLGNRPDIAEPDPLSERPDDMLETFNELAVKEPDLMRLVLQRQLLKGGLL